MGVQISVWVPAFTSFGVIPRSKIAGSYGISIFNFWEITILFSTIAAPSYTLNHNTQVFRFLHILVNTCYCFLFFPIFFFIIAIQMGMPSPTFDIIIGIQHPHGDKEASNNCFLHFVQSFIPLSHLDSGPSSDVAPPPNLPWQHPTLLPHLSYQFTFTRTPTVGIVRIHHDHTYSLPTWYSLFLKSLPPFLSELNLHPSGLSLNVTSPEMPSLSTYP